MSELHQEYAEGLDALGPRGLVFYKFFSMISVKVREEEAVLKFGPNMTCTHSEVGNAERIRAYVKEQKEWIRTQGRNAPIREMMTRMWWVLQKMIDYGMWSIPDQKYIVYWYDTCTEQLTTP